MLLISLVALGAGCSREAGPAARHGQTPSPEPKLPDQAPFTIGEPATVSLGADEQIAFLWIEAMRMWVGKHEVTNGQYARWRPLWSRAKQLNARRQPVVYVRWYDAVRYCRWLDKQLAQSLPPHYHFRLPTGREWTTFAACGLNRRFAWGDAWPPNGHANFGAIDGYHDDFEFSAPVAQSGDNEWGLFGVAGNVWEWCYNSYRSSKNHRMLKGASWRDAQEALLAIEFENGSPPHSRFSNVGFRVVIGIGR